LNCIKKRLVVFYDYLIEQSTAGVMNMTTATSLKLPDGLKERIQAVVESSDDTAHAFMLKAIRKATEDAEWMKSFVQEALEAEQQIKRTGKAYDGKEVIQYLRDKAAGKNPRAPKLVRVR
jgi:predicted transcriptional regulator